MKKHEEFDLEIAIESILRQYPYEEVKEQLGGLDIKLPPSTDYDEYEDSEFVYSEKDELDENPEYQIVEEILDWYEKKFGKLSKVEKDELRIEICYNYEINFE